MTTASATAATGSMLATMLALLASMRFRAIIEAKKPKVHGISPISSTRSHASGDIDGRRDSLGSVISTSVGNIMAVKYSTTVLAEYRLRNFLP